MRWRWWTALLVPLLIFAWMAPDAEAKKSTIKKPKKPSRTFESALIDARRSDGTLPKKAALAAFETAIGPLPGVKAKPLPRRGLVDGTGGIRAILSEFADELTPAQRRAVQKLLTKPIRESRVVPEGGGPVGGRARPTGMSKTEIQRRLAEFRSEIAEHLGRELGLEMRYSVGALPESAPAGASGFTYPINSASENIFLDPSQPPTGCMIALSLDTPGRDEDSVNSILAHEVFHCFQYSYSGRTWGAIHDWIGEGQAAWVGETLASGSSYSQNWWNGWLSSTLYSLFYRAYSAIGFYADLDANGIDPWSVFDAMLGAGADDLAAYNAAVGVDGAAFLDVIAKALVRRTALGTAWESTGPGITDHSGWIEFRVTPESTETGGLTRDEGACGPGCAGRPTIEHHLDLDAYSTQPYQIDLDGDVAQFVTSAARGVMGFEDGTELSLAPGRVKAPPWAGCWRFIVRI